MNISFETFSKLNLCVGEVKEASEIEEADNLLLLSVDVGEAESRQIVAGIKPHFEDPEQVVGKQVVVLKNLEPKEIMGYESQGMVLVATEGGQFALLTPEENIDVGTTIR